jgi:hypothetical protein
MKVFIKFLAFAVALFGPIIYFTAITDNTNETKPVLVFVVCIVLFAIAGFVSSTPGPDRLKWIGWSVVVGVAEACLLAFAF